MPEEHPRREAAEPVEVRRSRRRRRTVTAFREQGRTVVCIPDRFSRAEEATWVRTMLERLAAQDGRRRPGDAGLQARAERLSSRFLDGRARASSVRWSATQRSRWGSCTPADGSIRVSDRLQGVPTWVLDYVLVHELTHLLVADHSAAFWELVGRYPRADRARGFLEGLDHARGTGAEHGPDEHRSDGDPVNGDVTGDGSVDAHVRRDDEPDPASG